MAGASGEGLGQAHESMEACQERQGKAWGQHMSQWVWDKLKAHIQPSVDDLSGPPRLIC